MTNILIKLNHTEKISNDLKKLDTWEIQLTIAVNFISFKDNDQEHVMHSKSDGIEIMINDKADEAIEERFKSLQNRYQINLEKSMKGGEFIFDYVHVLYYKCHKINPVHGGSFMDSPNWIKKKKATINPVIKDNKCFQYTETVTLNHEELKKNSQRITKLNLF